MSWFHGVPILMYHEVAEAREVDRLARLTQRGYIVLRDIFERQMAELSALGFNAISLHQLRDWARLGTPLPPNPVVITFDDGFAGNFHHALPALIAHGFTATFFVVTNRVNDVDMLSWSNLRAMHREGMAIESHTANHPLLSGVGADRTRHELVTSKHKIEDVLGSEVAFVSLPNGDSNEHYLHIAQTAGYAGGCGSQFGLNQQSTDCYFWRRIAIKQTLSVEAFRSIVTRQASAMMRNAALAVGKRAIARALGKERYDRLYNHVFGVQEQDKSKQG